MAQHIECTKLKKDQDIPRYIFSTDDDGEFVELFNAGQSDVDMSGYQFVQGFDYTFPNGTTIGAGKYLVVARSKERFKADHGTDADLEWGPGSGNGALSNSGEDIVIVTASGDTVDVVDYDDEGDWGRRSRGRPVHVRSENLGLFSGPTRAGQEAHALHDQLSVYRPGIAPQVRWYPSPSAPC